jgi:hypothetical protein
MNARVTDENAPVAILDPAHPVFNFPNKITDEDFNGWVQERNLYAFSTFDQNYKPLLESHDAGEGENKGGLTVAEIGKGNTSIAHTPFSGSFQPGFRALTGFLQIF